MEEKSDNSAHSIVCPGCQTVIQTDASGSDILVCPVCSLNLNPSPKEAAAPIKTDTWAAPFGELTDPVYEVESELAAESVPPEALEPTSVKESEAGPVINRLNSVAKICVSFCALVIALLLVLEYFSCGKASNLH